MQGRSPTCYSPVRHSSTPTTKMMRAFPFDLHVLSTPPAFVLSQDQTLQKNKKITGKKQRNQQNKNKQQTANTKKPSGVRVHVHVQTIKFVSSNDTLSSSQTTPPPTTHTPRCKGRKQRPHKYTNPTTKPQTPTSQQQKPGKTIQSLLAFALDVTNTGT